MFKRQKTMRVLEPEPDTAQGASPAEVTKSDATTKREWILDNHTD